MAVQGDGAPPEDRSFDKATVDRWQVFGGMAGVAALLLSVVGGIQDLVPLSLIAAGAVTLVGVVLLYRWGRRPRQQLTKHFVVPVLLTVVGAATGGVLGGLELRPTPGTAQPGANPSATTTTSSANAATTTTLPAATTTRPAAGATTTAVQAGSTPGQFRAGKVTLNYEYSIDLDSTGENGGVTDKRSPATDLTYEGGFRSPHIVVVAEKGVDVPPSRQECIAATGLDDYVEASKVSEGAAFCVKTGDGRWAGLAVAKVDSYTTVEFEMIVWE